MAAGNERNGSSNFNRALSLINEAVTMLRASPGNEETTSARESTLRLRFQMRGQLKVYRRQDHLPVDKLN